MYIIIKYISISWCLVHDMLYRVYYPDLSETPCWWKNLYFSPLWLKQSCIIAMKALIPSKYLFEEMQDLCGKFFYRKLRLKTRLQLACSGSPQNCNLISEIHKTRRSCSTDKVDISQSDWELRLVRNGKVSSCAELN